MALFHDLTALEAAAAVRSREVSPVELVEHALDRIARLDDRLGAFVTLTADAARRQAKEAERTVLAADDPGSLLPLLGVPTAIKDLNLTKGVRTKLGSASYADFVSPIDDYIVELLRAAGTISLGKTATPEFGLPCYTETDIGPPTRSPWDPARMAGGSSGGAAAAVAAGLLPIAQGSDGGGSIRIPASVCGLVGLKPSRGRVSRGPLDFESARLAVFGGLTRTVRDAAAFLDAVAIPQPGDPDRPPAGRDLPRVVRSRAGAYAHRAIHRVGNSVRSGSSSPQRVGTDQRTPRESRPRNDGPPSAPSVGRRSVLRDGVVGIGKHRARRSGARELASAADPLLAWPGGGRDRNRVRAGDRHALRVLKARACGHG